MEGIERNLDAQILYHCAPQFMAHYMKEESYFFSTGTHPDLYLSIGISLMGSTVLLCHDLFFTYMRGAVL